MHVNIYALCEPGTTTIRYIGKTRQRSTHTIEQSLKERLSRHLYALNVRTRKNNTHVARWLRSVVAHGHKPEIMLIDVGNENTWPALEMFHIAAHKIAGYHLTNVTDGGEGCNGFKHSPEHLGYMSRILTGRKRTPEQRARMSEAHKKGGIRRKKGKMPPDYISPMRGRQPSQETRLKLSIAAKKRANPKKHEVVTCVYCGVQFKTKTCAKRKYCSNECTANGKAKQEGRGQPKIRPCLVCGNQFTAQSRSSRQKCCSKKCGGIARNKQVIRTCKTCGKDYSTPPSLHPTFCSDECRRTQGKKTSQK